VIGRGAEDLEISHRERRRDPEIVPSLEPISPELALIDPALARADLARLAALSLPEVPADLEVGRGAADRAPPEPAAPDEREARAGPRWLQRVVLPIILALSLGANGVLLGIVVGRSPASESAPELAVALPMVPPVPTSSVARTVPARSSTTASRPSAEARAAIEQRILALVVQSPGGKLPSTLVDQRTGLAKNNLQAACHSEPANSFLCVVRPVRHRPGEGLIVRYRPSSDGRGSFAWYPYRSG
jgi:hypothetical protein